MRGGQGEHDPDSASFPPVAETKVDNGVSEEHDWTFAGEEGEEDELLVMATKACGTQSNFSSQDI